MTHAYLLQENGHQIQLERQANAFIILETGDDIGLHLTGQKHSSVMIGPSPQQLIPVEFTFRLLSCLISGTGFKICVRAGIKAYVKSSVKVKSALLRKFKESFAIKSSILLRERFNTIKFKSSTLVLDNTKLGIFANTQRKDMKKELLSRFDAKKKKEFLLRKLKELLDSE